MVWQVYFEDLIISQKENPAEVLRTQTESQNKPRFKRKMQFLQQAQNCCKQIVSEGTEESIQSSEDSDVGSLISLIYGNISLTLIQ